MNTWTHTMSAADVREMLRFAHAGQGIAAWRSEAVANGRLVAGSRRISQLRIATSLLRPVNGTVSDDPFLADLAMADEASARDMIWGRYLSSVDVAVSFARRFLRAAPRLPHTSGGVSRQAIDAFLDDLLPDCTKATRNRTRTAIGSQFSNAGIASVDRAGTVTPTRRVPAPLAILHLIHDELLERREATDVWLAEHSLAAAIFGIEPQAFARIIEDLVASGRLRRSYYAGEPRILAA